MSLDESVLAFLPAPISSASVPQLFLISLLIVPLVAVFINVVRQQLPRDRSLPPLVFHWVPFIGSTISYGKDPIKFFMNCRAKHGDVFTYILLGKRVTVALGPKGNDFILGGKHTVISAEDIYAPFTTPVFGKDVVYDVPNSVLMEQKKFVKVALTMDKFRAYVGMVKDEVLDFMNRDPAFRVYQGEDAKAWGSFDVLKTLAEMSILTAARTLQGKEVRNSMNKGFAELYADLDHGFTPLHFMFPNLPLPSYRKRDAAHTKMSQFYQDILQRRKTGGEGYDQDVMASLMNEQYRDGRALRDHEIAHIMMTLLMAGQHTSSTSSAWTLLHLAEQPDIAQHLYQEQVERLTRPDGGFRELTYEDLRAMPVLDSVLRETLRMHPPIHSIMRNVRSDLPVPPTLAAPSQDSVYVVPKGDVVLASPAVSQVDPLVWDEPLRWKPSRWLEEEGVAAVARKLNEDGEKADFGMGMLSKGTESPYLPFGAGRHRCIGEQFAYLQVGMIVLTVVREIELRLEAPFPQPDYSSLMVQPHHCEIKYRRRTVSQS